MIGIGVDGEFPGGQPGSQPLAVHWGSQRVSITVTKEDRSNDIVQIDVPRPVPAEVVAHKPVIACECSVSIGEDIRRPSGRASK
jgi:hypothetical protein